MIRLAAILLTLAAVSARADVVFLNDGRELTGAITRADAAKVYLSTGGAETAYPRADVLKLKLVREWRVPGEDVPSQIADPALRRALKDDASPADYPDDGHLIALDERDCVIDAGRRSTCTSHRMSRILRERGKDRAANVSFTYLDGLGKASIVYARSITDGKISYLDDTSVEDGSDYSQYPEYDRQKSVKFAIPNVSTSSWLDYRWREETEVGLTSAPFSAVMTFREFEPSLVTRFTVTAPKSLDLRWYEYKMPPDAKFSREEKGATVVYSWETQHQPSFKEEDSMPPYWRIAPQVRVAPADTWEHIAANVSRDIGVERDADAELTAKTAEIVKGMDSDDQKAEALYNWVVRQIKYVNLGMAQYSYLPKPPGDIYAAKSGNTLDKPFLLYVMLRAAGLKPQLVYASAKNDTPFDPSLPTLEQFTGAAVRLELGGRERYLAPFDDVNRWDALPGWLQGMTGLVVDGDGVGSLVQIPQSPAADESLDTKMKLTLGADGSIAGTIEMRPRGYHQEDWRGYKDWKTEDLDLQFEKIIHDVHPNARLQSYAIEGLNDMTRDLVVRIAFEIKDYAITASGGYLAFQVPWTNRSAGDVGKPTREQPMFWYNRDRATTEAEIALPPGYELYSVPEPVGLEAAGSTYRGSYEAKDGALLFRDESTVGVDEISTADYPKYKALREQTARFTQKWIVLKKKS